jgi:hypothetical protein
MENLNAHELDNEEQDSQQLNNSTAQQLDSSTTRQLKKIATYLTTTALKN